VQEEKEEPAVHQIGERVARLRRIRGWKQKELASRLGCTLQQVSKLERRCWLPRLDVLARLADTFNVTADYLLTGRGPRRPGIDLRLRERLPALDRLPESQRDSLLLFLDALILAHHSAGLLLPAAGDGGEDEEEGDEEEEGELE
jgi:transcriptional regulator with XRE-family HTH domain